MKIDIYNPQDIASDKRLIRLVDEGIIRQCSYCRRYVSYMDFSGETKVINNDGNTETLYDCCSECKEKLEKGIEPAVLNEYYYEDYIEGEDLEEY